MNLKDYKNKQMEDTTFKTEYENLGLEYEIIEQLIEIRQGLKLT